MKKTLLFLIALFAFGQMAWAQSIVSVNYVDENGVTQPVNAISLDEIAQVNPNGATIGTSGFTNCYVVQGSNVVMNGQLGYYGGINLILCDGAKLTINTTDESAIQSQTGNNQLTIYVQANGTGQLIVNASNNNGLTTEYLTINGGVISVTSGGTGIHADDNLIINRGTVTVNSDGNAMYGYNVTINGGNVSATSTGNAGIANGATGTITLGYTTNNDRIYASSYQVGYTASLSVKDGQYFITDDGQFVYGGYNKDYVGFLAGRTLSPFIPTEWSGGGNSANDPYIITSVYDLNLLSLRARAGEDYTGKYFRLDANITFTHSTEWDDITDPESNFTAISIFDGHFDGNNKTISGLRLHTSNNFVEQKGLFCTLGPNANVENLTLSDARIAGEKQVGAIVGYVQGGAIVTNCHVTGTVTVYAYGNTLEKHGGIVGKNEGTVSNCVSEVTISRSIYYAYGSENVGGIAGYNTGSLLGNKVFNADITAASSYGAIAGLNDGGTLTNNYYRACTVNGTTNATGVGCNGADVTTGDGAMSIHTITKPNDVTINTEPTLVYGGTNYWKHGTTITLSGGLGGTPTAGWQNAYFVNNVANTSDPFTPSNTFPITPARDIEITIGEIHADWATSGAQGTEQDPYLIYFPDQLDLLATRVNNGTTYDGKYFKLMDDLTYSYNGLGSDESNYTPIGSDLQAFHGHFDGNNKSVSGIRIRKTGTGTDACYLGLFGSTDRAEVKDVTIKDTQIVGHRYLGGVVGHSWSTMVSGCHVWYTVSIFLANNDSNTAGGIVGYNRIYQTSTVTNCTSEVHIHTNTNSQCYNIGGIVGLNGSVVSNNFVMSAYIDGGSHFGAVVGQETEASALSNNYYRNCVVNNLASNVGCDGADVTDNDGAVGVYTITINAQDVILSSSNEPMVTYQGIDYWKSGQNIALEGGLNGTPAPGYQKAYFINGEAVTENTFVMPANDVS
ncbi:MAG: carbohydrate-binding domain-containing protein, partial [Bacteroidales bacterium]|nr:carbohydrate-binding domain-containing protein [Bacteroidales bacterium]